MDRVERRCEDELDEPTLSDKGEPVMQRQYLVWVAIFAVYLAQGMFHLTRADEWSQWKHTGMLTGSNRSLSAIASDGKKSRIVDFNAIYSADPAGRTLRQVVAIGSLWDIAWSDGLWVAVGNGGALYTSEDGDSWTKRVTGVAGALVHVAGGNGNWIACKEGSDTYLYSEDGVNWTERNYGISFYPETIAWGNGTWIVASNNAILRSTDGMIWSASTGATARDVTWTGTRWLGVNNSGKAVTSADGVQWSVEPGALTFSGTVASSGPVSVTAGSFGRLYFSTTPGTWTQATSPLNQQILDIKWTGLAFVGVGDRGAVVSSVNGITWKMVRMGATEEFSGICEGPNGLLAIAFDGSLFSSSDGFSWVALPRIDSLSGRDLIWNGTEFVAVSTSRIWVSPNGINWGFRNSPNLHALASDGTRTVAVGPSGTIVLKDATHDWTAVGSPTTSALVDVAAGGGKYLAIASNGSTLRSVDGVTWQITANTAPLSSITWTGTRFIGVASDGSVVQTTDGSSWSPLASFSGQYLTSVTGDESRLVVTAYNAIYSMTADGLWTRTPVGGNLKEVVKYRNGYVAGGVGFLLHSSDGASWTSRLPGTGTGGPTAWGNGSFVGFGGTGATKTSADGEVWTYHPAVTDFPLSDICYGPLGFMAVGQNGTVIQSETGIGWTSTLLTGAPYLTKVKPFLDGFLTMGSAGKSARFSAATGWTTSTLVTSGGNASVISLATSPSSAACVSYDGHLSSSTDGHTWTFRKNSKTNVIWDGSRYIASGNAITSTSPDGLVWVDQPLANYPKGTWLGKFDDIYLIQKSGLSLLIGTPESGWVEVAVPSATTTTVAFDGNVLIMDSIMHGGRFRGSFSEWADSSGIPADHSGVAGDSNADGIPNGMAFILGYLDADSSGTGVFPLFDTIYPVQGLDTIEFRALWPAPDEVSESIWFNNDLSGTWTKAAERTDRGWVALSQNTDISVVGEEGHQRIILTVPTTTPGQGFFRRGVSLHGSD